MGTSSVGMGAQARGSRSWPPLHGGAPPHAPVTAARSKLQHGPVARQVLVPAGRFLLLRAGEATLARYLAGLDPVVVARDALVVGHAVPVAAHQVVVGKTALRGGRALLVELGLRALAARLLLGDASPLLGRLRALHARAGLLPVLGCDRFTPLLELAPAAPLDAACAHPRECDEKCDEDDRRNYCDGDDRAGGHSRPPCSLPPKVPEARGGKRHLARRARSPGAPLQGRTPAAGGSPSRWRSRRRCAA